MLTFTACGGTAEEPTADSSPSPTPAPSSNTATEPVVDLPAARTVDEVPGSLTVDSRPSPDWVLVAAGSAWVANVGKGIGRYDARTGEMLGSVGHPGSKGEDPAVSICTGMTSGYGSLWAVDCATDVLFRVDLTTGKRIASIKLPSGTADEGSITAGGGEVFVVASTGVEITRIDVATNRVAEQTLPTRGARGVRFGFGSLWVTHPGVKSMTRIEPSDGRVLASIEVGAGANFQDVGFGSVWVMSNSTGVVSRIDPETNEVITIPVSAEPVDGGDLTVGGDSVWARVSDVLVARIDPTTNQVVERIGSRLGSGSADADRDAVWISAHDSFEVFRVPVD